MNLSVLFFATLKERAGIGKLELEMPEGAIVQDLKRELTERFPNLKDALPTALVAINRDFAFDDESLIDGAEVAFFPPVSGGSIEAGQPTIFSITSDVLDLNDLLAQITLETTGAACFFTGMVRAKTKRTPPHVTRYLEYEAYPDMAQAKMQQVADEIRQRWPSIEGIAIVQRIGKLDPGTPTVLIACTAAHRDTGIFEATRFGIDRLKEIVPVWKKEVSPSGEAWVEGEYIPTEHDRTIR